MKHPLATKLGDLEKLLAGFPRLMVAYSGGVDSSLLLAVAGRVLGQNVLGVIADSPSLPRASLAMALTQARNLGLTVEVLATSEFEDPRYAANPPDRCYFCKSELFLRMDRLARERGYPVLAYGENADDPPAQRPGSLAAGQFAIRAPLREAGLGKADVREIARTLGLESADLPAQPCLSSRIPHGTRVTPGAVSLIERGEEALRDMGFRILRVRLVNAEPPWALVQVAPEETEALLARRMEVLQRLKGAGFASVEIDPAGYRGTGLL